MAAGLVRVLALAVGAAGIAAFLIGLEDIVAVATCDEGLSRAGEQRGADCDEGTGTAIALLVAGAAATAGALLLEARTRRVWRVSLVSGLLLLAWPLGAAAVLFAREDAGGGERAIAVALAALTLVVALLVRRATVRRRRVRERGSAAVGRIERCDAETASDFSGATTHKVVVALGGGEQVKSRLTVPRGDPDPQPGDEVVVFQLDGRRLVASDDEAFARAGRR
jgi:hypothetical protein